MSFGQALFFGIGAYAVGLSQNIGTSATPSRSWRSAFSRLPPSRGCWLPAAAVSRHLLAMLSLAFSMILYGTLVKSETLGSTDGFTVLSPHFVGWAPPARRRSTRCCC